MKKIKFQKPIFSTEINNINENDKIDNKMLGNKHTYEVKTVNERRCPYCFSFSVIGKTISFDNLQMYIYCAECGKPFIINLQGGKNVN